MPIDTALALITLDEAKAYMKITVATEDEIVAALVNACSSAINRYCGRYFLTKDYTEVISGSGGKRLILSQFPVSVVTSINVDPNQAWAPESAMDISQGLSIDKESGIITLGTSQGIFPYGASNIRAIYEAGYALAAIPAEIKHACELLVSQHYRLSYSQWRRGIQSEQMQNRNQVMINDPIPKDVALMLDPYRVRTGSYGYA